MNDIAKDVALLFVAVSAADRKILEEEFFIMEKCAADYGIEEKEWEKALNISFITYFNGGDEAISKAIYRLSRNLDKERRKELTEDLLAIALVDEELHPKEKMIIKMACRAFGVHLKVPMEFNINSL